MELLITNSVLGQEAQAAAKKKLKALSNGQMIHLSLSHGSGETPKLEKLKSGDFGEKISLS